MINKNLSKEQFFNFSLLLNDFKPTCNFTIYFFTCFNFMFLTHAQYNNKIIKEVVKKVAKWHHMNVMKIEVPNLTLNPSQIGLKFQNSHYFLNFLMYAISDLVEPKKNFAIFFYFQGPRWIFWKSKIRKMH